MTPPIVLCLVGARGSGKDTTADALSAVGWHVASFADPLREAVAALYGLPIDIFTDRELKEKPIDGLGVSPRTLLQRIGTNVLRNNISAAFADTDYRPPASYFAHLLELGIRNETRPVVITDCRFADELDYLRSTIDNVVPCVVRRRDLPLVCTHVSDEFAIAMTHDTPADWLTLDNDGSIDDIAASARALAHTMTAMSRRLAGGSGPPIGS